MGADVADRLWDMMDIVMLIDATAPKPRPTRNGDHRMLLRPAVLKCFGLPDRAVFEIEPHRDDLGMWRIKVAHDGDPAIFMSQGHATKLADVIRPVDYYLADQIDACIERAVRYTKNSN